MQQHKTQAQLRARQLESQHPNLVYMKRLDLAAKELGWPHYTALQKMSKLLGAEGTPSRLNILHAGGDPALSPMRAIDVSVGVKWGSGGPPSPSANPPYPVMTEADVRAVIAKHPELTYFGWGCTRQDIEKYGSFDAAMQTGREQLVDALDECNKAIRYVAHLESRKTINPKAGSSYGLKHQVEHYMRRVALDRPPIPYTSNGALICAVLHQGFRFIRADFDSPNLYFNISSRSPILEWRRCQDRRSALYHAVARERLEVLATRVGAAFSLE